jgi:hypothetical protein
MRPSRSRRVPPIRSGAGSPCESRGTTHHCPLRRPSSEGARRSRTSFGVPPSGGSEPRKRGTPNGPNAAPSQGAMPTLAWACLVAAHTATVVGDRLGFRHPEGDGSLPPWSHQQQGCFAHPKASVSLAYTPEAPKRETPPCRHSWDLRGDGGHRGIATVGQAGCSRHAGQPVPRGESRSFHIFCKAVSMLLTQNAKHQRSGDGVPGRRALPGRGSTYRPDGPHNCVEIPACPLDLPGRPSYNCGCQLERIAWRWHNRQITAGKHL